LFQMNAFHDSTSPSGYEIHMYLGDTGRQMTPSSISATAVAQTASSSRSSVLTSSPR
jgi:hypothetical protein